MQMITGSHSKIPFFSVFFARLGISNCVADVQWGPELSSSVLGASMLQLQDAADTIVIAIGDSFDPSYSDG